MSGQPKPKWVVAGGETLLAREIAEYCSDRKLPVAVTLVSAGRDPAGMSLTEVDGEAAVLAPLNEEALEGAAALFLAGAEEECRNACRWALDRQVPVIDLEGSLAGEPRAQLRAPALEEGTVEGVAIHVLAHPAAIVLCRLQQMLHGTAPLRSAVVQVFEPASARGKAGVDELHQQTVSLFNFQPLPQKVFDIQTAYNLLPRLGEGASVSLTTTRERIRRDLNALLAPRNLVRPSLRVLHAPVFHGYCFSLWAEFESRPDPEAVEQALRQEGLDVRTAGEEPASNAGAAGQSGIVVSDVAEDEANPHGMWVWAACDNLRITAENAVLVAAMFLGGSGRA